MGRGQNANERVALASRRVVFREVAGNRKRREGERRRREGREKSEAAFCLALAVSCKRADV